MRPHLEQLESDGYCIFSHLLDPDQVLAVRPELVALLEADLEYRATHHIVAADHVLDGYTYSLTPHMHTMLFPAFRSRRAAELIECVLTSEVVRATLGRTIGERYRMRVDLVRLGTGADDSIDEFQVPHEWHRDSPGEFTFGVFLDDMTHPWSGGTAVVSGGTHFSPYDPVWDFMIGPRSYTTKANYLRNEHVYVNPLFHRLQFFHTLAKRRWARQFVEIRGKPGDVYLFLNDVWHGRAPNKQGKRLMTMRFGGFPTDFSFKDDLPLPMAAQQLPPRLREAYRSGQPTNIVHGLLVHRTRRGHSGLLARLAHFEKRLAIAATKRWE